MVAKGEQPGLWVLQHDDGSYYQGRRFLGWPLWTADLSRARVFRSSCEAISTALDWDVGTPNLRALVPQEPG